MAWFTPCSVSVQPRLNGTDDLLKLGLADGSVK
jgi:hypothetical protein